MKYLRQFLLILFISFLGELLKYLPAIADTGKHLWHGDFIYRVAQWNH